MAGHTPPLQGGLSSNRYYIQKTFLHVLLPMTLMVLLYYAVNSLDIQFVGAARVLSSQEMNTQPTHPPSHTQQPDPEAGPEQPEAEQSSGAVISLSQGNGSAPASTSNCPLGRGGADCAFGLDTIFRGRPVYSSLKGSPELRQADLQGWSVGPEFYVKHLETVDARAVIEVGVWRGLSASFMAKWLKDRGSGFLIAIDTWLGSPEMWVQEDALQGQFDLGLVHGFPTIFWSFLSNMVAEGVDDVVIPLPQPSKNAAFILEFYKVKADLVHIDAAHEYESVTEDIKLWFPFVRHGGILMGDDYHFTWPGVQQAADEFASVCEFELMVDTVKWAVRKPEQSWFNERPHLPEWCSKTF